MGGVCEQVTIWAISTHLSCARVQSDVPPGPWLGFLLPRPSPALIPAAWRPRNRVVFFLPSHWILWFPPLNLCQYRWPQHAYKRMHAHEMQGQWGLGWRDWVVSIYTPLPLPKAIEDLTRLASPVIGSLSVCVWSYLCAFLSSFFVCFFYL